MFSFPIWFRIVLWVKFIKIIIETVCFKYIYDFNVLCFSSIDSVLLFFFNFAIADTVHYFLCLIRHGAQVIVTQMVSTDERGSDGTLSFTNHIQLRNLPADFSVVFEVYALVCMKDLYDFFL